MATAMQLAWSSWIRQGDGLFNHKKARPNGRADRRGTSGTEDKQLVQKRNVGVEAPSGKRRPFGASFFWNRARVDPGGALIAPHRFLPFPALMQLSATAFAPRLSQAGHLQLGVGIFPSRVKLFFHPRRIRNLLLRSETVHQAEKRAWVSRIFLELFPEKLLGVGCLSCREQRASQ